MYYIPCEDRVKDVISQIESYFEKKQGEFKSTDISQLDENPNVFSISTIDKDNFPNIGIVGWSEEDKDVRFCCFDSTRAKHDEQEGVDSDDSKCWWEAKNLDMFILFLNGDVRKIVRENYENCST